jgi:hypothetical protein
MNKPKPILYGSELGVMLVEFALSIMVFLIVVFGIFDCIMFGVYHNRLQNIVNEIGSCASLIPPVDDAGVAINRWNNGRASTDPASHCYMANTAANQGGVRQLAYDIIARKYPEIGTTSALQIHECSLQSSGGATACCRARYGSPDTIQAGCQGTKGGFKTIRLTYNTGFFNVVMGLLGGTNHITTISTTAISKNSAIDQHENP